MAAANLGISSLRRGLLFTHVHAREFTTKTGRRLHKQQRAKRDHQGASSSAPGAGNGPSVLSEDAFMVNQRFYLKELLIHGRLSRKHDSALDNPPKLFQGIGPDTAATLEKVFNGERDLIRVLNAGDPQEITKLTKFTPRKVESLLKGWEYLCTDNYLLSREILRVAGLPANRVMSQFGSLADFNMSLVGSSNSTLLKVVNTFDDVKTLSSFCQENGIHVRSSDVLLWVTKAVLEASSQVGEPLNVLWDSMVPRAISMHDLGNTVGDELLMTRNKFAALLAQAGDEFVNSDGLVYLRKRFEVENDIARLLKERISYAKHVGLKDEQNALREYLKVNESSLECTKEQLNAIQTGLLSHTFGLTGGPGTGKTHCLGIMVKAWQACGKKVEVATFTARSARVIFEKTGVDACTLHRLLQAQPGGRTGYRFLRESIDGDVLVIDEATMVGAQLMLEVLSRLKPTTQLVLIGDADQLSSVNFGNVFKDLLDPKLTGMIARGHLTQPHRQLADSLIYKIGCDVRSQRSPSLEHAPVTSYNQIIHGDGSIGKRKDTLWISTYPTPEITADIARRVLRVHKDVESVQVLVSKDAFAYNQAICDVFREFSGKQDEGKKHVDFVCGDRVMHMENDYEREVYNGEVGTVLAIEEGSGSAGNTTELESTSRRRRRSSDNDLCIYVAYPDRTVRYRGDEVKSLSLAYAMTIHKSQGGEFPIVILVLTSPYLNRELIYTGVSRAKSHLIILGSRDDMGRGVSRSDTRHSRLVQLLCNKPRVPWTPEASKKDTSLFEALKGRFAHLLDEETASPSPRSASVSVASNIPKPDAPKPIIVAHTESKTKEQHVVPERSVHTLYQNPETFHSMYLFESLGMEKALEDVLRGKHRQL